MHCTKSSRGCVGAALRGLILLVLLEARPVHAQTNELLNEAWRWIQYTSESGLPANQVLDVVETTEGVIWAITERGLAWYDGFRWHAVGLDKGVPERRLTRFLPAPQGKLIFLYDKQLYQGDQRGFATLPIEYEGVPLDVYGVASMQGDTLLIRADEGLYRYHSGDVVPFSEPDTLADLDRGFHGGGIRRTSNGALWVLKPHGVHKWTGAQWVKHFDYWASFLHEDRHGGLLAVSQAPEISGLWTWSPGRPPALLPGDGNRNVAAVDVGASSEALVVYSTGEVRYRNDGVWRWLDLVPPPLKHPRFVRFQQDGDLWVGTDEGLFLHRRSSTRWSRWHDVSDNANALLQTRTGDLWVATSNGLFIGRADGTTERIASVGQIPLGVVTSLAEDRQGGIWVSSGGSFSGAFRWYEGTWQHVGPEQGLPASRVHKIVSDRQGRLWFLGLQGRPGNLEPGAFVYENDRFTQWGTPQGLLHGHVYTFAEDPEGAYWFGTQDGISRWHDGQWTHWTVNEGLAVGRVFTLAAGPEGRVWFGHYTSGHGVGMIDGQGGSVRYYTVEDGLVDNRVWDLQLGSDGVLWISTENGLGRYHEGAFTAFGAMTGLEHPRLWPVLPLDDRVFVGTASGHGVYVLSLDEAANPPPRIEVSPPLFDEKNVHLRWQAFAYRGELSPGQILTRYQIDRRAWSPWGTQREVSVLGISPGEHTFTVQAKSLFGTVDPQGVRSTFHIAPPFYQHPLFLGVLAVWLVSLIGLGGGYWRRQRRYLAEIESHATEIATKNAELEARNAELERFTYTVSHDLKSPLVTIKGFLGLLYQDIRLNDTERVARDIEQIGSAADKMARLLHELLELSRVGRMMNPPETVSLSALAAEAASLVAGQIAERGVLVEIAPAMPMVQGDRVRLLEVYQNLIDNAVKFMGDQAEPRIEIGVEQRGEEGVCYVRDNGMGIAPQYHDNVFGLFNRLDVEEEGTGIGLALVKRIVEVHEGRIWVESQGEGYGSTFWFTLPGHATDEG